jgi:hypothetical protein
MARQHACAGHVAGLTGRTRLCCAQGLLFAQLRLQCCWDASAGDVDGDYLLHVSRQVSRTDAGLQVLLFAALPVCAAGRRLVALGLPCNRAPQRCQACSSAIDARVMPTWLMFDSPINGQCLPVPPHPCPTQHPELSARASVGRQSTSHCATLTRTSPQHPGKGGNTHFGLAEAAAGIASMLLPSP